MVDTRTIWCCQCQADVPARLTSGGEVYPHRPDLADVPRWKCDRCGNHVGTHHKSSKPLEPLGNIPSQELRKARIHIHALIDPAWKAGKISRRKIYKHLTAKLGRQYHTAELRSIDEARLVYREARELIRRLAA